MKGSAAFICAAVIISGTITSAHAEITSATQEAMAAETIEVAKMRHSLINDKENYEIYQTSAYARGGAEDVDLSRAYLMFYVDDVTENVPGGYFASNREADISSGLVPAASTLNEKTGEVVMSRNTYYFRHYHYPLAGGYINFHHRSGSLGDVHLSYGGEAIPMDARSLFFDTASLARIVCENGMGRVTDIRLFAADSISDAENVLNIYMIYIEAGGEEYVISDARYDDGRLSGYDILDREAFIAAMNGDTAPARELGYKKLALSAPPEFSDISGDSAVSLLARLGIIDGYDDGSFAPDRLITRAEAARMLAALALPKSYNINLLGGKYENVLTDVDERHWAYSYIEYGYISGYIDGKEQTGSRLSERENVLGYVTDEKGYHPITGERKTIDTYAFHPEDYVTEQELAKMIVTAIEPFARMMATAEGGWPRGYVSVASRMGICKGASDAPATRLVAAHMMRNALDAGVNTKNNLWLIDNWDTGARVHGDEMIYERSVFFNNDISAKRIRLIGTLTGEQRENELYFTAGNGTKQTVIARYSDVKDFIGKECVLYCAKRYGNTEVIMAEPAEPIW